jgi:hypothetical protein
MGKDSYPNGRRFVQDFGDSRDFEDRLHEKILAGGGYYVSSAEKFVGVDNIPSGDMSPEEVLIMSEETRAERYREQRKEHRSRQIVFGLSCSGKPKTKKIVREFRTPLSETDRRAFIRNIPLLPVYNQG